MAIYSHVQLCQQPGKPITDNRGTRGRVTRLVNQSQQTQTEQPFGINAHTDCWWIDVAIIILNGDKSGFWNGVRTRPLLANSVTYS